MKAKLSLRLRVTLVCGVLLAVCCLLLTLTNNYYAYAMVDAIEAIPLEPAQALETLDEAAMETLTPAQATMPARNLFRVQSFMAMAMIVAAGCLMVYWLTGKALAPLAELDRQIRSRTASNLNQTLPVPASGDEVAGLTVSFNQMSQTLNRAFEQQRRFSQCAAHELRTPLAVLQTRMALFRKKGLCATPETAQLLDVLEDQTHRLSDLVGDLLSLSNMDGLECSETMDAARLVTEAAAHLEALARQQGCAFVLDAPPATVVGNRALLERAVSNLMENAVKYGPSGGTVTVAVRRAAGRVQVAVTDQGPGIPADLREQIFEPFFRVDKSRSRQLGGAGLGLSLVRAIAALHRGTVWVEPAPAGGSRFILSLPEGRSGPDAIGKSTP